MTLASATSRRPVRHALAEALGLDEAATARVTDLNLETVDVAGAAALLHTTPRAIYVRHQRGQMPKPLRGRRLVWRKADLLNVSR